ncbi:MAG: acyl-CoA dehydrogenase family protein [Nitrospinota bacterium]
MADFSLTEKQRLLRELARDFAQKFILPAASLHDEEGSFAWEVYEKAFEQGLMNPNIPARYGGPGLGCLDTCVVMEELAWGCGGIASSWFANVLATEPILLAGTEEQKERFLRPFTQELRMGAFCLTEPGAGTDVGAISTTARREGECYIIDGHKCFITNGGVASLYVIFASTDRELGTRGISAFIVPSDTPGVRKGKKEDKMGQRAADTAEVLLEEAVVPSSERLGEEGDGFKIAMKALDWTRPGVAALATGVARAAFEAASKHALEREQFGAPIVSFQGLSFMLADMAKDIEAARLLTRWAAWLMDRGERNTAAAAMAKVFATDAAMRVTTDAVQVLGGYGYMKENRLEKYMRDVKLCQIYEGTNQILRAIIARELFGGSP